MTKTMIKRTLLLTTVMGVLGATGYSIAQAQDFSLKSKDELNAAIKEYILENPEVLFESIERHRAQQEKDTKNQAAAKITQHAEYLASASAPSVGNVDGDITIVEFFDYNCGYCKRALTDIQKVLETDKNLRVVFKDMAILGPSSRTAALWSLAAHKQGKYFDYHVALMNFNGPKEEAQLMKLAADLGLDAAKLKEDANSPEIAAQLDKDAQIANEIGVQGTPAFIVGSEFVPGYIGEDGLKALIKEQREKRKNDG